jgi:16S rRNA (uracil1498-N3)-methyltransferase
MPPRLYVDQALTAGSLALPANAARHVQVLRLQPGDPLTLFDGRGGEWVAEIALMDRRNVQVQVLSHNPRECENPVAVMLALAMPANDRMDALVEKATELGAAAVQPLVTERSVLRLAGERGQRRQAHWQAIAIAACEQCGRNSVPTLLPVQAYAAWVGGLATPLPNEARRLLGWRDASPWADAIAPTVTALTLLSGPEGGLTEGEEDLARARGFSVVSLGPRVLRADTAPLAALASISLRTT